MVNWRRYRRKRLRPDFKVISRHSPAGTDGNQKNPQSGWPVSGPRRTQDLPNEAGLETD
jgi:hypothetical protein